MEKSNIKLRGDITISDLKGFIQNHEKEKIADFILQRLEERYITPLNNIPLGFKNGFNIMANCCLLIETYESYRTGLNSTSGKKCFLSFFTREEKFNDFIKYSDEFYSQVRCGILHQGETKGIWRINRDQELISDYRINATKFLKALHNTLIDYKSALLNSDWTDLIWINCNKKLNQIILDCSVYYFAYGSNMDKSRLEIRIGADNFNIMGRGILKDYELKFNKKKNDGSAAANVEPLRGSKTEGVLFEINPSKHQVLDRLDGHEGVRTNHYYRRMIDVEFENTTIQAFIYIANRHQTQDGIFPTKEYLDHLLASKPYLSENYYRKLLNQRTK